MVLSTAARLQKAKNSHEKAWTKWKKASAKLADAKQLRADLEAQLGHAERAVVELTDVAGVADVAIAAATALLQEVEVLRQNEKGNEDDMQVDGAAVGRDAKAGKAAKPTRGKEEAEIWLAYQEKFETMVSQSSGSSGENVADISSISQELALRLWHAKQKVSPPSSVASLLERSIPALEEEPLLSDEGTGVEQRAPTPPDGFDDEEGDNEFNEEWESREEYGPLHDHVHARLRSAQQGPYAGARTAELRAVS